MNKSGRTLLNKSHKLCQDVAVDIPNKTDICVRNNERSSMKIILGSFMLVVALVGYGKEKYSDPQKFVDHYGREMLGEYYKDGMELMGYKGFEFSNAKVGIDRNGREYVSALVSLIVPRGETYYRRLEMQPASSVLKIWPSDKLSQVIVREDVMAINAAYKKLRRDGSAPVVYSAESIDIAKIVSPWRTIRIIRLKDGEGVYHPVGEFKHAVEWYASNGDERSQMFGIPTEPFYIGGNGLLSGAAIKKLGAVKADTPEAVRAQESYVKRLAEINAAIARLNACCVTQAEIVAIAPSYATTNATPRWIWERQQKEAAAFRARVQASRDQANGRNREAKDAVRNAQNALGRLNSQVGKAEKALARERKNLADDTKQLERLTANAAKARRTANAKIDQVRERVTTTRPKAIADAESALTDLKKEVQSAESALADAKSKQDRIDKECQQSVASAETEGQKALDQAIGRLDAEYQDIKQKCFAELKSATDDCKQKLGLAK